MVYRVADTLYAQNLAVELGSVMNNKKIQILTKESSDLVPFVSLKVYLIPTDQPGLDRHFNHDDRIRDEHYQTDERT